MKNCSKLDKIRTIVPDLEGEAVPGCRDNFGTPAPDEIKNNSETLKRKAKRKDMTRQINRYLVKLKKSPLQLYYERCGRCGRVVKQKGNELTTWYCQCRHCLNCCAIRTAKMINAYLPQLKTLEDPQMVTLTIRDEDVTDTNLHDTVKTMIEKWRTVYKSIYKKWWTGEGIEIKGFRGTEVTGSWLKKKKRHKYHPHFHIIIDGLGPAQDIVNKWLELNPTAERHCQHIRQADDKSIKEILKYFTKFFDKKYRTVYRKGKRIKVCYSREINIHRLDVMMQAVEGLRMFNAFGVKKILEDKPEEIFDSLEAQTFEDMETQLTNWYWQDDVSDWVDITTGECLSGNSRTDQEQTMIDAIRPCGDRKTRIRELIQRRQRKKSFSKYNAYG